MVARLGYKMKRPQGLHLHLPCLTVAVHFAEVHDETPTGTGRFGDKEGARNPTRVLDGT